MARIKGRVPAAARDPLAIASVGVMVLGLVVGYVLVTLGISVYLGLVLPADLTAVDATIVTVLGLVAAAAGYLGWRGFVYFSY